MTYQVTNPSSINLRLLLGSALKFEGYELQSDVRGKPPYPIKVILEDQEVRSLSSIRPRRIRANGMQSSSHVPNSLFQCLVSANKRRKISTQSIWEVVNSILYRTAAGQEWHRRFIQHTNQLVAILNMWQPNEAHGGVELSEKTSDTQRQMGHFMAQPLAENTSLGVSQISCLLVLLLSNVLRLLSNVLRLLGNVRSSIRRFVCEHCHHCSGNRCYRTDKNRSPIGQVSYVVRQRTKLNRHRPSLMLEGILP
ncbi:TPA: hypothetical protein ACKQC2_000348 [Stenotrophomonas maltophilia]